MNLAPGWPIDKVETALSLANASELVTFLKTRYESLFLIPLEVLAKKSDEIRKSTTDRTATQDDYWQFGFAIMSLSCLLVEVLYCYTAGLPSTHRGELKELHTSTQNIPQEWVVPETEWPSGTAEAFRCFFNQNQRFFPGIDGGAFYESVRNGLLHQGQTKNGYKIKITGGLWNKSARSLDREEFRKQLRAYFNSFLETLTSAQWPDPIWQKTARKIWWLILTSKQSDG
jgi:hypothetical protein